MTIPRERENTAEQVARRVHETLKVDAPVTGMVLGSGLSGLARRTGQTHDDLTTSDRQRYRPRSPADSLRRARVVPVQSQMRTYAHAATRVRPAVVTCGGQRDH